MNTATVITEKMVSGGDCLAKTDGKVVFIPGALAGETLLIEITEEKKDFSRGRIVEIISPSEHRIDPTCPYYGQCGGCNLQMASYEYQISAKKKCVQESFIRSGIPAEKLPQIECETGKPWEYRNRLKMSDGGFRARESHTIVPVKDCPVAVPEIRSFLAEGRCPSGEVHLFGINGAVTLSQETDKTELTECNVSVCGVPFLFDVRGFFQSNLSLLDRTVELVCGGLSGKLAADIYSGVGLFARFLSEKFDRTIMVEHNRNALAWAEKNMAEKQYKAFAISGAKWAVHPQSRLKYDAVVVDPPRSGLEKELLAWLISSQPAKIRMLSCDPVTAARDCSRLVKAGYRIEKMYMLDFYPQTSHIETLICLETENA